MFILRLQCAMQFFTVFIIITSAYCSIYSQDPLPCPDFAQVFLRRWHKHHSVLGSSTFGLAKDFTILQNEPFRTHSSSKTIGEIRHGLHAPPPSETPCLFQELVRTVMLLKGLCDAGRLPCFCFQISLAVFLPDMQPCGRLPPYMLVMW